MDQTNLSLALWKYCLAEWNGTDASSNRTTSACQLHGKKDNCTGQDTGQWDGHFTKCPEGLSHYCVHGECRYIKEQETPSCRCQSQYYGARCEYVSLDWLKGDGQGILIGCTIAGLLFLIFLIVSICVYTNKTLTYCQKKKKKQQQKKKKTGCFLEAVETQMENSTFCIIGPL
uniref:Betacellulin, epidermal growth factor family member n=1 Tax=Fundulus heteroclitus TaxID=8078 RepID=A0A3Q2UR48_FUNHE